MTLGHSRKYPHFPKRGKLLPSRGAEEEKCDSDNSWCIRRHLKGIRMLIFNFLCPGGMDVFWNNPF